MKISELVQKLNEIKASDGDLIICTSERDDYWGRVYSEFTDSNLRVGDAQPKGPKSGESERAVIIDA
jgi:hypothetical protein